MVEFFTALMSGHWLAVFAGWIWETIFVSGTAGAWSLYTSAFGHAGLLWWFWAFFLLIVAIVLIAYIWIAGIVLYLFWFGAWVCWLLIWVYYLLFKLIAWLCVLIWHLAIWIWPVIVFFLKAFIFPTISAFALAEMLASDNRKSQIVFPFAYCGYFIALFALCPLSWAVWFTVWTWVCFIIALGNKGLIDDLFTN